MTYFTNRDLHDVLATAKENEKSKHDLTTRPDAIAYGSREGVLFMIVPNGTGLFETGPASYGITPWALNQICAKLGPPPASYIRQCPAELAADNLAYWQNHVNNGDWFVRLFDDSVRAVLSDRYVPISNLTLTQITTELIDGVDLRGVEGWHTPDRLRLKIEIPALDEGIYSRGFTVGNGEIGNASVAVNPYIKRGPCDNTIEWSSEGYVQRHIHTTVNLIRANLKGFMGNALEMSGKMLERMIDAETEQMPDLVDVVNRLAEKKRLPNETRDQILIGTERQTTLAGLVNGLSYAAHAATGDDPEARADLETLAGNVLMSADPIAELFNRSVRKRRVERESIELEELRMFADAPN